MGLSFKVGDTSVSVEMELLNAGVPVTGATVLAAIRRSADNAFLDFNDNTFKAAGWTTKFQTLTDLNGTDTDMKGIYRYSWDSSAAVLAAAEYQFIFKYNDGVNNLETFDAVAFEDAAATPPSAATIAAAVWNSLTASFVAANSFGLMMKRIKASLLNRQELAAGSSNNMVTYDDDGSTPLLTASVTDKDGSAITLSAGVPAKRGNAS